MEYPVLFFFSPGNFAGLIIARSGLCRFFFSVVHICHIIAGSYTFRIFGNSLPIGSFSRCKIVFTQFLFSFSQDFVCFSNDLFVFLLNGLSEGNVVKQQTCTY